MPIHRIDSSSDGFRYYKGVNEKTGATEFCYPSVTTKIDAVYPKDSYLINWIREQGIGGQAIFEKAGDLGTEIHVCIDTLIRGGRVEVEPLEPKVKKCVQSFINWANEFKPVFIASETMLVNHSLKVAGTRDALVKLNYRKGKEEYVGTYVLDWKSSSTIQEKHKVQVSGYWASDSIEYKTALVHLGNRTKAGYSFIGFDPSPYFEQFTHFNRTFNLLYPDAQPKVEEYPDRFELDKSLISKEIL